MKKNFLILTFIFSSIILYAHPGRLDSNGGHWNRKTGEYHYHRSHYAQSQYKTRKNKVSNNNEVIKNLKTLGYSGKDAIKNFQRDNGLTPDGVAGVKTKQKIKEKLGK